MVVVEDLDLHACVSCVALERSANADAVVAARLQLELALEDEILVLFLGEEVAAAVLRADDVAVPNDVTGAGSALEDPSVEGLPVEELDKALCAGRKVRGQ